MSSSLSQQEAGLNLDALSVSYAVPRRYRDYLLRPFQPAPRFEVFRDLSLRVTNGARLAVVGKNGAGKTTLLKTMAGLILPKRGRVLVDGESTASARESVQRTVAYVFNEERSFYWRLTGRQNLEFFAALDHLFGKQAQQRIDEVLVQVGLEGRGDTQVAAYSSGMRQRLALARGLLKQPRILLLDEPTRSLDPLGAEAIRTLLRSLLGEQHILVMATNQLEDALALCSEITVLSEGRLSPLAVGEDVGELGQLVRQRLRGSAQPDEAYAG